MSDWANNKLVWIMVIGSLCCWILVFGYVVTVNRVTDKVIERLQKEYSPSPYSPGFDPDKVNPKAFKTMFSEFEKLRTEQGALESQQISEDQWWRYQWERERMGGK